MHIKSEFGCEDKLYRRLKTYLPEDIVCFIGDHDRRSIFASQILHKMYRNPIRTINLYHEQGSFSDTMAEKMIKLVHWTNKNYGVLYTYE
jgi:hypothetical protein